MPGKIAIDKKVLLKNIMKVGVFILSFGLSQCFADTAITQKNTATWSQFRFDQENTGFNQPVKDPFSRKSGLIF